MTALNRNRMPRRYHPGARPLPGARLLSAAMAPRRVVLGALALLLLPGCRDGSADPSLVSTTTSSTAPTTTSATGVAGSDGVGDPYFPTLGNGGFDVGHYDIAIRIDPDSGVISDGATMLTATAVDSLSSFNLDFVGLEVTSVSVDGVPAEWSVDGEDLVIVPVAILPAGETFTVAVGYRGRPLPTYIPSVGVHAGWIVDAEGVYVAAEPNAAHTWFPGNDHPSDKATFAIAITVPSGWVAASNGTLAAVTTVEDGTTFAWVMDHPMATYLATVAVGTFERIDSPAIGGVTRRDYLPVDLAAVPPPSFDRIGEMLDLLEDWFGPYPFSEYGHVVVPDFPGALETQTMTLIGRGMVSDQVVVHELAHQWYGDDVSIATWSDIWLNEGFATFAEFIWLEHDQGRTAMDGYIESSYQALLATPHRPPVDPGDAELFGPTVYLRGGLALHALRAEVGDDTLKAILTTYAARYSGGNATTDDFLAVVDEIAGVGRSALLDPWLYTSALPPLP